MEEDRAAPFGALLRELRIARGLSQEALAERARMSVDGIGALERGIRRAPQRQTLTLLASGLELSDIERERFEVAATRPGRPRGDGDAVMVPPGRHNLPLGLTSFLGRERERALLRERLGEVRLVTLTGIGGVGKTRLAIELAYGLVGSFPDGVWLVELAPLADPALLSARVAKILGVPQGFDASSDDAWIVDVAPKRLLVVLDNCEHVLEAAAALTQRLLEHCPGVRVVATSREPLRVGGERVYRLESLEMPAPHRGLVPTVEALRGSPAIQMFFDRARYAVPEFSIAEDDEASWRALLTICTRLDGMPLAIELAAARMNAMSLETLASALDHRFDLLTAGARTALPRHQTLRALLDWSYDLLAGDERCVLRRLAVFVGGWTLGAAEFVCASEDIPARDMLGILASLVDKSLVFADTTATPTRYGMLETTRAYALERLGDRLEFEAVSRAHAQYCLDLLQRANAAWGRPSLAAWLAPLEPELDNVRAAMAWSLLGERDAALAANIAKSQHSILELLSLFGEGVAWCDRALAALGERASPKLEAPLHLVLAKFYARCGQAMSGLASAMRAAELYRALADAEARSRDRAALAISLALVGRNLVFMGRGNEADRFATEAVEVARAVGEASTLAWTLYVKALTVDPGDLGARRSLLGEARDIASADPESFLYGLVILGLGHAEFDAGDLAAARAHGASAMEHYRRNGFNEDLAIWSQSLSAVAALAAGDVEGASVDARDALAHARRWLDISLAIQVVASVAARRGRFELAAHIVGASEALFAETPTNNIPITAILHDRTLVELRAAVPEQELARWLRAGRGWSFDRIVAAARSF